MGFLGSCLRLLFIGGGVSSVVFPSLIAAGYKDYNGQGKPNRPNGSSQAQSGKNESSVSLDSGKKKQISDNATKVGKSYGINVGRIPGKTKISGKLKSQCNNSGSGITLGRDKGNIGIENGKANKNLFGEVRFNCQNKSGTLYLKGEGGSNQKRGGYGRVVLPKN